MTKRCQKVVFRLASFFRGNFFRFKFAGANLIGDIACNFGETANLPGIVTKRGNNNLGFER
jgi:hypothetical protein